MSFFNKYISIFIVTCLFGCASPTVVQSVKPGDDGLSCAQLQNEFADAERFKKEAQGEKGVTGGNVARLLFWPSIIGFLVDGLPGLPLLTGVGYI
jgi:hypothetical protein